MTRAIDEAVDGQAQPSGHRGSDQQGNDPTLRVPTERRDSVRARRTRRPKC